MAAIIGEDFTNLPDVARGFVILRFFAPEPVLKGQVFSQMVTAEAVARYGPGLPEYVFPLDVERPQGLAVHRRVSTARR